MTVDRERDRAPSPFSIHPDFATCMRLAHPREILFAKSSNMSGVVCDVCRRVIRDGEPRSRCSFCDNDICTECESTGELKAALEHSSPEWPTRRQLFRDDPGTRTSIPRRTALFAKAREILARHRAEIERRADWRGEFITAEFIVRNAELGDFPIVTMVHAFSQLGKEFHGMTFTRVVSVVNAAVVVDDEDEHVVSVAYPFEAARPVDCVLGVER